MISSAFKSAAVNEQNQKNQFANTIGAGIKDGASAIAGAMGFAGALGGGAIANAAKYNLAGKIGGIGGAIMLSTMDEKATNAQLQKDNSILTASDSELKTTFDNALVDARNTKDYREIQALSTVWNKIQGKRQSQREDKIMKRFEDDLGGVHNGTDNK